DRGSSRGSENRKTYETERPYSRRDFTPPRGTRGGGGAGGSGEYSRPPLPPLRVDSALVPSLPPPLPSLPPQLQPSCPPPLCGQEAQLAANDGVAAAVAKPPLPQLLLEESVRENGEAAEAELEDATRVAVRPPPSRKNGAATPVLPQHLISQNPGAMLFCRRCRLFLAPHPVSVANHLQSEGHQNSAEAPPAPGATYTQFGKLVQRMPSFIEPVTVVSEEQRQKVAAAGNTFFEGGFDIVNSTCGICQEVVTTQSYKVHESLPTHRRRVAEANADTVA
ncbi:uncharacterized protein Tco025E_08246, partial [Trypanosoma conorhini]